MRWKRWLAFVVLLAVGVVAAAPGLVYAYALHRIGSRPVPADPAAFSREHLEAAWTGCSESLPMRVDVGDPWTLVLRIWSDPVSEDWVGAGERVAQRVAMHHVAASAAYRYNYEWHAWNAALGIWITRHWTAEQLAATAARDGVCVRRG